MLILCKELIKLAIDQNFFEINRNHLDKIFLYTSPKKEEKI